MLVCFTDGATEAQNAAGEEFSEERLLDVVARHAGDGLESLLDEVRREVTRFTGRNALDDDCTLLALRRPRGPGISLVSFFSGRHAASCRRPGPYTKTGAIGRPLRRAVSASGQT